MKSLKNFKNQEDSKKKQLTKEQLIAVFGGDKGKKYDTYEYGLLYEIVENDLLD